MRELFEVEDIPLEKGEANVAAGKARTGRDCGTCSMCCNLLEVKDPDLDKPANKICCPHRSSRRLFRSPGQPHMSGKLTITVSPVGSGEFDVHRDRFAAHYDGRLLCTSRTPFLSAARVLLAEGHDPAIKIAMRHAGSDTDCLTSTIGVAAQLTVNETANAPRFAPYSKPEWDQIKDRISLSGQGRIDLNPPEGWKYRAGLTGLTSSSSAVL